jgi:transcriptional regulator with XRE-family HTH domain
MRLSKQLSDQAILRELGHRLSAARLARNLTQATLAEEAGVSKRTVERLESGEVATRLSGLVRVCRALGLIDRLEALIPAAAPSPVEQLKLEGRRRRRASGRRQVVERRPRKWKWGDGS